MQRLDDLQYKELIYTSDDYKNHVDLFEKSDICISNPPFSLNKEIYKFMFDHNVKFIFMSFAASLIHYHLKYGYLVVKYYIKIKIKINFLNKQFKSDVRCVELIYSDKEAFIRKYDEKPKYYRLFDEIKEHVYYFDEYLYEGQKVLNINYIYDLPLDYDGYFGLPCTYITSQSPIIKNIEAICLINNTMVNGKKNFTRVLCKWKDINDNKKYIDR